jgi:2-polyprenyl-3-methyl-5-hydroxy-6-metoxy-1,4-benzoquinol methylase
MAGYSPPFADSRILDLFRPGDLDRHETILRGELKLDHDRAARGALNTAEARQLLSLPWWQRIFDERTGITTLSDHTRLDDVAGPPHTLYGRFSEREASLLRPWAKWLYLEKLLPDMRGKNVLEIGSSCGFWSFKFAELGAARVTGVEAIADHADNARIMAERKGISDRVSFITGDAFYDRIDRHDIVFHSEVLVHSLVPHHSFLRTLGLAKELVIADEYFG